MLQSAAQVEGCRL